MKKVSFLLSLALLLASLQSMSQTLRMRQDFGNSVSILDFQGKAHISVTYDTVNYIEVKFNPKYADPERDKNIFVAYNRLTVYDTVGENEYAIHVRQNQISTVHTDQNCQVTYPDGDKNFRFSNGSSDVKSFAEELKSIIDEFANTYDSVSSSASGKLSAKSNKRRYSVSDRTNFDFHWGFNNWGDTWYNGLMKMEGPYNLRTSFSSFQLSENYAIVMTPHFKLSLGIGYESDVYKFSDNYVSMGSDGALATENQAGVDAVSGVTGTSLGDWSTRLVTRYVTMPIEIEYRDKSILKSFKLALGIVPGLSFNSSHTGLKHELERKGRNYQDVQDVSKYINPYKLDVRLTFKRKSFGVFIQVPTLPLFIDTDTKVYPIKIGFMI